MIEPLIDPKVKPLPITNEQPGRLCGNCSACCTVFQIEAVPTSANQSCMHDTKKGCAIYANRPAVCRGYKCLWLTGQLAQKDRPDRSGFLMDRSESMQNGNRWRGIPMVRARLLTRSAGTSKRFKGYVAAMAKTHVIATTGLQGQVDFYGPKALLAQVAVRMKEFPNG